MSQGLTVISHAVQMQYLTDPLSPSSTMNKKTPQKIHKISRMVIDYWVSFATSLDPNDGLGTIRPNWLPHTSGEEVCVAEKVSRAITQVFVCR